MNPSQNLKNNFYFKKILKYCSSTIRSSFEIKTKLNSFEGLDKELEDEILNYLTSKRTRNAAIINKIQGITYYLANKGRMYDALMKYKSNIDYSDFRITVDTFNDFQVIDQLINLIGFDKPWIEYIELIKNNNLKDAYNLSVGEGRIKFNEAERVINKLIDINKKLANDTAHMQDDIVSEIKMFLLILHDRFRS